MRRKILAIAALLVPLSISAWAQHSGKHGSTPAAGTATQPEDSDVATFKHAIDEQATEEQIGQYRAMVKTTEAARQQAQDFQRMSSSEGNPEAVTSKANVLQDAVDRALTDTQNFRRSFTDSQEATLKAQAKKLAKSNAAVSKSAKSVAEQLEQGPPSSHKLLSAAANLEKEIAALQSDQSDLGKHMGIPAH